MAFAPAPVFAQKLPAADPVPLPYAEVPVLTIGVEDEAFVPFKCPIERIRSAYQNLVNPDDTLVALAIEKQTLAICRQSQEALIRIAENEARLKELFEPIIAPPPAEPTPAPAFGPTVPTVPTLPTDPAPPGPRQPEFAPPSYALAAVMKDALGFKAMIVDGEAVFTVREGDRLDDGGAVVSIGRSGVELVSDDGFVFFLE